MTASTAERGYGAEHQALRATWAPKVNRGTVACWRCGRLIDPDDAWDLGHRDGDRTIYEGPEHVACNRATAGRRGERSAIVRTSLRQSRSW